MESDVSRRGVRATWTMVVSVVAWVLFTAGSALGAESGEDESRLFTAVGGEFWASGPTGGHGVVLAHWRWRPDDSDVELDAQFNTDTLRLEVSSGLPVDGLSMFARVSGQYPVARLLTDYYRRGERVPGREFQAGYVSATPGLEYGTGSHFVKLEATGRRWFFRRADRTASALALPAEAWTFEPTLHYTFWQVEPDPSQWELHQPFQRIRGTAFGVSVGTELRSSTRAWGARGPEFRPPDPRNTPEAPVWRFRQWSAAGASLGERVRVQFREEAGWGFGEDDLTRDQLGGLSPYSVRIAGLPWGALFSGRYLAGHFDVRVRIPADHEVGLFVDGAAVSDPRRVGDADAFGAIGGAGLLADLRFGPWKVDARGGTASPVQWLEARPLVDAWLSVGRVW